MPGGRDLPNRGRMTLLYTHPSGFQHVTPPSHPEQVARLTAVTHALDGLDLDRRDAPEGADDDILRCHPASYLSLVRRKSPDHGWSMLDADTYLSPGSLDAARHTVGGVCAAVDAVLAGQAPNAFVAMRPPGHHAERAKAMGFCIFNAIAIGAMRALEHHGLDRIAVLDFDVHHGNGTQDILWNEPRALFASTHQAPLYPGTGAASERGAHDNILNLPLHAGSDGVPARAAWRGICDRVGAWQPQLVLVSAGFDAHADDPLAALGWDETDFTAITRMICDAAVACSAPVVSVLEGGYDLGALGRSARAHVEVLKETAT